VSTHPEQDQNQQPTGNNSAVVMGDCTNSIVGGTFYGPITFGDIGQQPNQDDDQ
jgi:hypothetical protein